MRLDTTLYTDGSGYWSTVSQAVRVKSIQVCYINEAQDFGELCVFFDRATWNTSTDGLIYTDDLFLTQLREELNTLNFYADDISYSEQGMQGDDYVSLDVGQDFLQSFERVCPEEYAALVERYDLA